MTARDDQAVQWSCHLLVDEWNLDDLAKSPHVADVCPLGSLTRPSCSASAGRQQIASAPVAIAPFLAGDDNITAASFARREGRADSASLPRPPPASPARRGGRPPACCVSHSSGLRSRGECADSRAAS